MLVFLPCDVDLNVQWFIVYTELRSRSPERMKSVFRKVSVFTSFLYCTIGFFGVKRFCEATPGNILAFPSGIAVLNHSRFFAERDELICVARIAETLTCLLALPLIQHPTRLALDSWIKQTFGSREDGQESMFDYQEIVEEEVEVRQKGWRLGAKVQSLGILLVAFWLAVKVKEVRGAWDTQGKAALTSC